jgi:hypothetical protein
MRRGWRRAPRAGARGRSGRRVLASRSARREKESKTSLAPRIAARADGHVVTAVEVGPELRHPPPIRPRVRSRTSSSTDCGSRLGEKALRERAAERREPVEVDWKTTSAPSAETWTSNARRSRLSAIARRTLGVMRLRASRTRRGDRPTSSDERAARGSTSILSTMHSAAAQASSWHAPRRGSACPHLEQTRLGLRCLGRRRPLPRDRCRSASSALDVSVQVRTAVTSSAAHDRGDHRGQAAPSSTGSISRRYAPGDDDGDTRAPYRTASRTASGSSSRLPDVRTGRSAPRPGAELVAVDAEPTADDRPPRCCPPASRSLPRSAAYRARRRGSA